MAIGDYRCEDGVTIARTKKRTYLVLSGGLIEEFSGQSVDEARKAIVQFIVDLSAQTILTGT